MLEITYLKLGTFMLSKVLITCSQRCSSSAWSATTESQHCAQHIALLLSSAVLLALWSWLGSGHPLLLLTYTLCMEMFVTFCSQSHLLLSFSLSGLPIELGVNLFTLYDSSFISCYSSLHLVTAKQLLVKLNDQPKIQKASLLPGWLVWWNYR